MTSRALVFSIVLLLLQLPALAQAPVLEKRRILDNKAELLVPAGFVVMDAEMLRLKYPAGQPPQVVFTNEKGTVNVAFNWTQSKADQAALPSYEQYLNASLRKAHPKAEWYGHGLRAVNGRQVGYQEMLTPAIDTDIYNQMFFTDLEGRLLIVTFNCLKRDMETWKPSARRIMESLKILR